MSISGAMGFRVQRHRALLGMAAALAFVPSSALAASFGGGDQAEPKPSPDGEGGKDDQTTDAAAVGNEIIVTAQKREQKLQDVPISISVVSGEQLDSYTGGTARDILRTLPAVSFTGSELGDSTTLAIRGVGAVGRLDAQFASSAVGFYVDGLPFGFVQNPIVPDLALYDLDRIEVLRGPQGTLYGASSLNGVVRVLTHEADLNNLEVKGNAMVSSTHHGAASFKVDSAMNVPLVDGKLAVRGVLSYSDVGGWIDGLDRKDINSAANFDTRFKIKGQPSDTLTVGLSYWGSRHNMDSLPISDPNYLYPGTERPHGNIDFDQFGGDIVYDLGNVVASSTTSYIDYSNITELDWTPFIPFGLRGIFETTFDGKVFSEELLFRSATGGTWRWSAGLFYRNGKDRFRQQCRETCIDALPGPFMFGDDEYSSESYAMFGEVTRTFLGGAVELTGGLRYFHDKVKSSSHLVEGFDSSSSFSKVSPRAVLTWHPSRDHTFYASYSQGFRSGFSQSATALAQLATLEPVKPDTLNNFEIGAKGNLFNNLISYSGALYYLKWKDTQQSICIVYNVEFCALAGTNVGSASGPGAELLLTMRPIHGVQLTGGLGVNGIEADRAVTSGGLPLYEKGDRLNGSPKYTASGAAAYQFPLGPSGLEGTLSLSAHYTSKVLQRDVDLPKARISKGEAQFSLDSFVEIGAGDRWSVRLFADNLTDERPVTQGFGSVYSVLPRPRTVGLQFEVRN